MEYAAREVDERDDQEDFERVDDMVADLGGGYVEAEDEGDGKAKDGGAAKDWVDADEKSCGYAPCEFFGRGSHAEEREYGKGDAAVDPIVMDRRGSLRSGIEIGRDRLHYGQDRLRNDGMCEFVRP